MIVPSIRCAESESSAGKMALLGQCHGNEEDGTLTWVDSGVYDSNWELHYSVRSCDLIESEDLLVLQKYL